MCACVGVCEAPNLLWIFFPLFITVSCLPLIGTYLNCGFAISVEIGENGSFCSHHERWGFLCFLHSVVVPPPPLKAYWNKKKTWQYQQP